MFLVSVYFFQKYFAVDAKFIFSRQFYLHRIICMRIDVRWYLLQENDEPVRNILMYTI